MEEQVSDIMNMVEVAAWLKISTHTVFRLAHAKKIPAFRVGGQWRFSRKRLESFAASDGLLDNHHGSKRKKKL